MVVTVEGIVDDVDVRTNVGTVESCVLLLAFEVLVEFLLLAVEVLVALLLRLLVVLAVGLGRMI